MVKSKLVALRLSEEDYQFLDKTSKQTGLSKSELLIDFIKEKNKNIDNSNIINISNNEIEMKETYGLRLSKDESISFKNYCDSIGETRSRILRKLVRELINNQYPDLLHDEQSMLRIVIRYLAGISRNFNQITVAINKGNSSHRNIDINYLNEIKKYVSDVQNELKKYFEVTRNRDVLTSHETKK